MRKHGFFLIVCGITLLGIAVRFYHFSEPIADWHSFRQVDTASVARLYEQNGIDLLHPRYHDLSNIQSGKDNPMGWRMVEVPLYQAMGVIVHRGIPVLTIEESLRLISIFASGGSIMLLAFLGRKYLSVSAGIASAFFYAVLPYSVYYGRVTLPEPLMIFLSLLSLYALSRASAFKKNWLRFLCVLAACAAGALAVLVKPFAGFLLLPVVYIVLTFEKESLVKKFFYLLLYAVITLVPFFWWRKWIQQYPEGIPVFDWLLNAGNIRFKGAWFYWLFAERIGNLISGYWGIFLIALGSMGALSKKKGRGFLFFFVIGVLLYFSIVARGNVQHDYYQTLAIPTVTLLMGYGIAVLFSDKERFPRVTAILGSVVIIAFAEAFSWYNIRGYYWINHPEIIEAGKAADRLLPANAKVIAPYNGDTTFLYQTHRTGWPLGFDIEKKRAMGAQYYVTVSPTDADGETKDLATRYTVLVRNDRFAIIDLAKPRQQP